MPTPFSDKEIKRYRRTHSWDYARGASLFITISTAGPVAQRLRPFGRIRDGKVEHTALGEIVAGALDSMTALNPGITVHGRVVMPDHVHFNVYLAPGLNEPLKVLGKAISRFKNYTIKQYKLQMAEHSSTFNAVPLATPASVDGQAVPLAPPASVDGQAVPLATPASVDGQAVPLATPASGDGQAVLGLWQQGYHDRLILTREFIDATERYIAYNPLKWQLMHNSPGALAIHEPLGSPRLDAGEYWKGVGNTALLDPELNLLSLRISRKVPASQIPALLARIDKAVDQGFVVLSGFISPGEKMVRDMLCTRKDARFIRILPSCIPNRPFKPESRYVVPFSENRYLEIGRGNDDVDFGRATCLDYNAEIVEIAHAGEGLSLYWLPDGPHRLP